MKRFIKTLFVSLSCVAALLPLHTALAEERLSASLNGAIVSDKMIVTSGSTVYTKYNNINGLTLSSAEGNTGASNIKFNIDDSIVKNIRTYKNVTVNVTYYDKNYGWFKLMYDSLQDNRTYTEYVYTQNTGEWKTYSFVIDDAQFNNASLDGSDFVLTVCDELSGHTRKTMRYTPVPVTISDVEVVVHDTTRRVTMDIENNGLGNIFFTGEVPEIRVKFKNRGTSSENINALYSVLSEDGEVIKRGDVSATLGAGDTEVKSISVPTEKYGLYRFRIEMNGDGIYDIDETGFSYNMLNKTQNGPVGFTAGYTWDIKTLPLFKNAGFQNVRTRRTAWVDHVSWDSNGQLVDKNVEIMVSEAKALYENGFDVFACLTSVPEQWSENGYEKLVSTTKGYEEFGKFVGFVAENLKPYAKYFELVNEPDLEVCGMTDDSALYYANMIKYGYDAIKDVDENLKVGIISASNAWVDSRHTWADKVFAHLEGGKYFDYLTLHPYAFYTYPHVPENRNMPGNFEKWRNLLSQHSMKYNDNFLFTELGYHTSLAEQMPPTGSDTASFEQARNRQIRQLPILLSDNIENEINLFDWADVGLDRIEKEDNFGMLHASSYDNPLEAKPVFTALCAYNKITSNALDCEELKAVHGTNSKNSNFVYKYILSDRIVYMFWNCEGVGTEKISDYMNDGKNLIFYDIYGNKISRDEKVNAEGVCTLTEEPFYVVDYYYNMQNFPTGEVEIDINSGDNKWTSLTVLKPGAELDSDWWKNVEYLNQYDGESVAGFNVGKSGNVYEARISGALYPVLFTAYSPEIEEINLYRDNKIINDSVIPGDNLTCMAKLPADKAGKEYALICAYYNDGVLVDVDRNEETAVNEIGFINHKFTLNDSVEFDELKIMLWDSFEKMIPIRNYKSYEVGGQQ